MSTQASLLRAKIENKSVKIGVVGLGYVGLPLAVEMAKAGVQTVGYDVSKKKVDLLSRGKNYIGDVNETELAEAVAVGLFSAQTELAKEDEIDVFFVCVPTPMSVHKVPDVSYIESSAQAIAEVLQPGQLVILKSTTYPGTTRQVVLGAFEKTGLEVGNDYFLAYSPERVDPGNTVYHTGNTPVVVGGLTETCLDLASRAMKLFIGHIHPVSSPEVAEMEKLLENTFRSVNIALVNELALLCDRIGGINMWEVAEAAATKPFGFMKFLPGPGVGGHCIPIDPYYMSWLARKYDFETNFITLAARINESMPYYAVEQVIHAIANLPISIDQASVLVLGVTFKKDVADSRHSLAEPILRLLRGRGVRQLAIADTMVDNFTYGVGERDSETLYTQELTSDVIASADVIVLVTDHSGFDYEMIASRASYIIDTRNAFASVNEPKAFIKTIGDGDTTPVTASLEAFVA